MREQMSKSHARSRRRRVRLRESIPPLTMALQIGWRRIASSHGLPNGVGPRQSHRRLQQGFATSEMGLCAARRHVCFTPNSDRESEIPQKVMSALPPKADMCSAQAHVCFGPIADMCGATTDVRFGPKADIALLIRQSRRHVAAEAMARPTQALSPS